MVTITGTTTAWLALLLWPFFSILFFRLLAVPAALTTTIVGGYLFLPEQATFNLPALPALDKTTIPALSALLALIVQSARNKTEGTEGIIPRSAWVTGLIVVMGLGVIGTVLTNREPLYTLGYTPGLRPWDLFASLLGLCITVTPFLIARKYLASASAQELAMKAFVVLALIYSVLALYEVRMSPQLNVMVYGFFQHDFAQHVRAGGYRPIVFLNHGLWVSLFFGMATVAAAGLTRIVPKERKTVFLLSTIWLYGTLVLSKSLGALVVTTLVIGLSFLPRRIAQIGIAISVGVVLAYPLMRSVDIVPTTKAVELASAVNEDRGSSLAFRFLNEDALLDHARQKPVFGWGGWGRNRAARIEDGREAVPDGAWIISMGLGGYVGFLTTFGLLGIGALALVRGGRQVTPIAMTMALMLTVNLIDLIPNATQTTLTWLLAGALAGRMELQARGTSLATDAPAQPNAPPPDRRTTTYARTSAQSSPYRRDLSQSRVRR